MARIARADRAADTRRRLIDAARRAFADKGYAEASMDDFTADAGLTRGALYHHFGDKTGLFEAVVMQIDAEMATRLNAVSAAVADPWEGFVAENVAYVEMALEPEIQRIVLRDGPAVLGDPFRWSNAEGCVAAIRGAVERLQALGVVGELDPEAAARMICGASVYAAQWIANADDPRGASKKAIPAFRALLEGLKSDGRSGDPATHALRSR